MSREDAERAWPPQTVADTELAAYLDGTLAPERRMAVERLLDVDRRSLEAVAVCVAKPGKGDTQRLYPGARVGRLQVIRRIASGGMGSVYEAYDPQLERHVALKFPREQEAQSKQVEDEARRLAAMSHPNVVTVHDVGRYGGRVFMAMEYLDGLDLRTHLRSEPMTWRAIVALYRQVAEALVAVHGAALVHRDVKPDNILVERSSQAGVSGWRVVVVDFGLATAAGVPTRLAGTPSYIAPELLAGGSPSEASDQFAFCVSLLEALEPGRADDASLLPGPVDAVPRRVLACVRTGCAAQPQQRHLSMRALISALDRAQQPRVGGAALVIGLCVVGAGVFGLATRAEPPPSHCPMVGEPHAQVGSAREIEARYAAHPAQYVRDLGPKVLARIGQRRESIASGLVDNCEERRDGAVSRADWDARERCYERRASELSAIEEALSAPDSDDELLSAALATLGELEHPFGCNRARPVEHSAATDEGYARLAAASLTMRTGDDLATQAHFDEAARLLAGHDDGELAVQHRIAKWNEIQGDYDGAAERLEAALLQAERQGDPHRIAGLLIEQVWVLGYRQQQFELGRDKARHARAWLERSESGDVLAFELAIDLGWLELSAGEPQAALDHFLASESLLATPGLDRRDASLVANGLGSAHLALGEGPTAATRLAAGVEQMRLELGPLHPDVGQMRNNLAAVVRSLGRFDEALGYFDVNLETFRGAYGDDHPYVGVTLLNRSTLLVDMGQLEDAERDARAAVIVYEALAAGDESHVGTLARAHKALADVLLEVGRPDDLEEAGNLVASVLAQQVATLGEGNPVLAETRHALALWHHARGETEVAIEEASRAATIIEEALGDDHPSLAPLLLSIGEWSDDPVALERAAAVAGPLHCAEANIAWAQQLVDDGHGEPARRHIRLAWRCYRRSPGSRAVLAAIRKLAGSRRTREG